MANEITNRRSEILSKIEGNTYINRRVAIEAPVSEWINEQTQLNASNMNKMSRSIKAIQEEFKTESSNVQGILVDVIKNIAGWKSVENDTGEIFNDYKNNRAIGENAFACGTANISGSKGFKITEIEVDPTDSQKIKFTLNAALSELSEYELGDRFDITSYGNYHWIQCGTIASISEASISDHTIISCENFYTTNTRVIIGQNIKNKDKDEGYDYYFSVPTKPHCGNLSISGNSFASGWETIAAGDISHTEGYANIAAGRYAHAEGYGTIAGYNGHSEGYKTEALGFYAHAEGSNSKSYGNCSHAEGGGTVASGDRSHAEGYNTSAIGEGSHAEGRDTLASSNYQHVQGKYNIEDTKRVYAHIVGNGSEDSRSNAHTLDWKGNAWFAGDVYVGSTSGTNRDGGSKKLATEQYVASRYVTAGQMAGKTLGDKATAEGYKNIASGNKSHAEGYETQALSNYAHAEGYNTISSGAAAHAEGASTRATADTSHAEGRGTIASSINQHAQGKYNIEDAAGIYAHIVGNGTSDTKRSNAHTLDWEGNAWFAGVLTAKDLIYSGNSLVTLHETFNANIEGLSVGTNEVKTVQNAIDFATANLIGTSSINEEKIGEITVSKLEDKTIHGVAQYSINLVKSLLNAYILDNDGDHSEGRAAIDKLIEIADWISKDDVGVTKILSDIESLKDDKLDSSSFNDFVMNRFSTTEGVVHDGAQGWDEAFNLRHTHDNKSTIDGISPDKVANWDGAYTYYYNNKNYLDQITQANIDKWNATALILDDANAEDIKNIIEASGKISSVETQVNTNSESIQDLTEKLESLEKQLNTLISSGAGVPDDTVESTYYVQYEENEV